MYLTGKFLTSFKAQRAKKAMTAKKEKKKAKKAMKANERDEVHVESIALDQEINEFFDWLVADDWRPMKAMKAMKTDEGHEGHECDEGRWRLWNFRGMALKRASAVEKIDGT